MTPLTLIQCGGGAENSIHRDLNQLLQLWEAGLDLDYKHVRPARVHVNSRIRFWRCSSYYAVCATAS